MRESRLWTDPGPDDERDHRNHDHDGNEPGGHSIGQALNGCSRPLRLAHHPDDLREQRLAPDALGFHDELAGSVHRPARHFAVWKSSRLESAHRSPSIRRPCFAFEHHTIHGNAFAWSHAKSVTDVDLIEQYVALGTVRFNLARRLRREAREGS